MTREDKLYSMRMQELIIVAEKLGIKINKKGAKSIAVEKILEAEHMIEETNKISEQEEQEKEDLKAAEKETKQQVKDQEKLTPKRGALLTYKGKSQNICAWAKELGKSANTLYGRIYNLGWSIEDAFEK